MKRRSVWLLALMLAAPVPSALAKAREAAPKATVVFRIAGVLTKKSRKGKKVTRVLLPAFVKTALKPGDEVRTHARSRAEVHLGDGVLVRLKENTVFKIEQLKSKKDVLNASLRLLTGKILLKIAKSLGSGSRVRVRTPTAVAAVRGTIFVVDAQASKTEIKVLEGTVHAAAINDAAAEVEESGGRDIAAGQEVAALQGQPLSEPEPMPTDETARETDWAQEPEMSVADVPSEEEAGAPEVEPSSTPEMGGDQSPEVVEPESVPTENPEIQQEQPENQPPEGDVPQE